MPILSIKIDQFPFNQTNIIISLSLAVKKRLSMIQDQKTPAKKILPNKKPLPLSNIVLKDLSQQSIFHYLSYFSSIKQFKETQQGLDLRRALLAQTNEKKLEKVIKILYNYANHARSEGKICILQFIRELVDSGPKLKIIEAIQRYFMASIIDAVQYRCHVKSVSRGSCFFNQEMNKQIKDNDFMEVVKLSNTFCRMNYELLYILGQKYLPSSNFGIVYRKLVKYCRFPDYPSEFRFYINTEKVNEISKKMKEINDVLKERKKAPPISERSNKNKRKETKRAEEDVQQNQGHQLLQNMHKQRELQKDGKVVQETKKQKSKQRVAQKQQINQTSNKQLSTNKIYQKNSVSNLIQNGQTEEKKAQKQVMKFEGPKTSPQISLSKDIRKLDLQQKQLSAAKQKNEDLLKQRQKVPKTDKQKQKQAETSKKQKQKMPVMNENIIKQIEDEDNDDEENMFDSQRVEKSVFLAKASKIVSRPNNKKALERNIIYRSSPIEDPDDITQPNLAIKKVRGEIDVPLGIISENPSKQNKSSSRNSREQNKKSSIGQQRQGRREKANGLELNKKEGQIENHLKNPTKSTLRTQKQDKNGKRAQKELVILKQGMNLESIIQEENQNIACVRSIKSQASSFEKEIKEKKNDEKSLKIIDKSKIRSRIDSQQSQQKTKEKQGQGSYSILNKERERILVNKELQPKEKENQNQIQALQEIQKQNQNQSQYLELGQRQGQGQDKDSQKQIQQELKDEEQSVCEVQYITLSKLDRQVNNKSILQKSPKIKMQQRETISVEPVSLSRIVEKPNKQNNIIENKNAKSSAISQNFALSQATSTKNEAKYFSSLSGRLKNLDSTEKPSSSRRLKIKKKLFSEADFETSPIQKSVKKLTFNHVFEVKENLFGLKQQKDPERGTRNDLRKSGRQLRNFREVALTIIPDDRKQEQQKNKERRQAEQKIAYQKMQAQIIGRFSQFESKIFDKNEYQMSKLKQLIQSSKLIETPMKIPSTKKDEKNVNMSAMGETQFSIKKSKGFFQDRTQSKSKTRSNSLTRSSLSQIKNKRDISMYCQEGTMLFLMAKKKSIII